MDSYIVLYRGDDSDFTGNQEIVVTLQTSLDLTGCKATFKFLDFVQEFATIPDDKKLLLIFPAASTSKFPLGAMDAEIYLTDASNKRRTIANRIHVVVTKSVAEAYDSEDTQAITVNVSSGVKWETIEKPLDETSVFDMNCSDWDFRVACATLWNNLGGKVINQ